MMERMRRSLSFGSKAGLAALVAVAALAASSLAQRQRVLHEPLPPPTGAASEPSPVLGRAQGDRNPAAISSGDKVLPSPSLSRPPADPKEPVLGTTDFGADRDTEAPPDRNTGADGTLHYTSVFNPDVVPFKRMSSLDRVRADYTLYVDHAATTELPVGGTSDASRDRFWGSVLVRLAPGAEVPLPSVAPDMRILSYETEPRARLTFSKDIADNFYVRSDESSAAGTYRLVFLADADARYFTPAPTGTSRRVRDVTAQTPAELRHLFQLPTGVREEAERFLARTLQVSRHDRLDGALDKLVGYFRSFEAKDPPPNSGNIYRDLCEHKAGVCRHRSFAFMITANALGLPTRFISNEAHAFVETWLPERGWQRIDLGGAALRLEVEGGEGKTLHRPRSEDALEKPPEYRDNYTQLEGDIRGLSQSQLADRRRADAPPSGAFDPSAEGASAATDAPTPDTGHITPDKSLPVAALDPAKRTPILTIDHVDAQAYRGGKLRVAGSATASGAPLVNHPIDIYVSRAGSDGAHSVRLGRTTTGADGRFVKEVEVPPSLALARYEVHVSSPEDARTNPALSE